MGKPKRFTQVTISSLKGVVVYEDLLRHKGILESKHETADTLLKSLSYLSEKKPCKEALLTTDIGAAIQPLCDHPDAEVAKKAQMINELWSRTLEKPKECQPTLEVRYDIRTQHFRNTSMKFFVDALGSSEEDRKLATVLEKEIFYRSNRLVTGTYRRTARKVIFVLKNNEEERKALKSGIISPLDFVSKYRRE